MKNYTVNLNHWVNDSGWSHGETFDHISEACTAEDYIRSLDFPLKPPVGCDDTRVEIWDDEEDKCISEAWVSDVYVDQ
jgi:hypothetical protein